MMANLHRRGFLLGSASLLAAPFVLRPTGARAATSLRLGHGSSETHSKHFAMLAIADAVRRGTQGRVSIEVGPNAAFGNDGEMMKRLVSGELDLTLNAQGAASAVVPELAIFGLPFLFRDAAAALAIADGPVGQHVNGRFEAAKLFCLGYFDNGVRHMTNSRRPIREPKDVAGLRMRTPSDPMTTDIFQTLGAATKTISYREVRAALEKGVVDGQENPPTNICELGFQEVNPFISLTAHKWECSPLLMTQATRERLGADLDVVLAAAHEAATAQRTAMQLAQDKALATCRATPGVQIIEVDPVPFIAATAPVARLWKNLGYGQFVAEIETAARA